MKTEQIEIFQESAEMPSLSVPSPFKRLSSIPGMSEKARALIDTIPDEKARETLLESIENNFKRLEGFDLLAVLIPVLESFKVKDSKCPICKTKIQKYKRRLRESLAKDLIKLYKLGEGFHHFREFTSRLSTDFCIVEFFDLAKPKPNEGDTTKRSIGYWELTEKGKNFVLNSCKVPKYIIVEKGIKIEESEELISISNLKGVNFDYSELMAKYESL